MNYQRVVISKFGEPAVLHVVDETSLPKPRAGEVRVRILVTSASFTDVMVRKGKYPGIRKKFPFSPGYDLVGVVDALGHGATRFSIGQRVAALTVTGAYSEYICLPENQLTPVPDGVDVAEAVSLVLSFVTPYQMLYRVAKVSSGQRILVHGAGGAVGTAMLQLGRRLNLEMYGTDIPSKHDLIRALGATPIDYQSGDVESCIRTAAPDGIDAVFDPIGGCSFKRSLQLLRHGGTLVAYGFHNAVMSNGMSIPLDLIRLRLWDVLPNGRSVQFYSIEATRQQHPDWFSDDLNQLFNLLAQGQIKPVIGARMPLAEARRAHELLEQGGVRGKIILMVNPF